MTSDLERIFADWTNKIQKCLEEEIDSTNKKEDKDAGPRHELEYWRSRMRKLTGISELLRSKMC